MKEEVNFGPSPQKNKKTQEVLLGKSVIEKGRTKDVLALCQLRKNVFFPPRPLIIIKVQHEANSKGGTCMSVRTAGDR